MLRVEGGRTDVQRRAQQSDELKRLRAVVRMARKFVRANILNRGLANARDHVIVLHFHSERQAIRMGQSGGSGKQQCVLSQRDYAAERMIERLTCTQFAPLHSI